MRPAVSYGTSHPVVFQHNNDKTRERRVHRNRNRGLQHPDGQSLPLPQGYPLGAGCLVGKIKDQWKC